jgi:hypothetical protein
MSDRAAIVTASILAAVAGPLRQRAQEAFGRGVPENLVGLMHDLERGILVSDDVRLMIEDLMREELAGISGEWELLGDAAARVVDRIDVPPSKGEPR